MYLRRVGTAHTQLIQFSALGYSRRIHGNDNQRLVIVFLAIGISIDQGHHEICLQGIGNPHLGAIDNVVSPLFTRMRLDSGHIRTGMDFRDAHAGYIITGNRGSQKFMAQLIRPKVRQRRCRHIRLHTDRHWNAAALDMTNGFPKCHGIGYIKPHTTKLHGLGNPQQARITQLFKYLVGGEWRIGLPFVNIGIYFLVDNL